MNFLSKFNYKSPLNLAWLAAVSLFLLTPTAKAIEINKIPAENVCPSANLLPVRSFDTAKYSVYICRGDKENSLGYYVRISKTDGSKITVPVSQKNGENYIAVKGEVTYAVTPYELLVGKQNRIVFRERVNSAIAGDGQPLAKGCPKDNSTFVEAETKSFIVYICGSDTPGSYVFIDKYRSSKIALPLQNYNPLAKAEGSKFAAVNGNMSYVLTRNVLKVSQDGQTIVKEKVLRWN